MTVARRKKEAMYLRVNQIEMEFSRFFPHACVFSSPQPVSLAFWMPPSQGVNMGFDPDLPSPPQHRHCGVT